MGLPVVIAFLAANIFMMFTYRIYMGIFFGEKRTGFRTELCMYLITYFVTAAIFIGSIAVWKMIRPPVEFVLAFVISLNYDCPKVKRIAVAGSMMLVSQAAFGIEGIILALHRAWGILGAWGDMIADRFMNHWLYATLVPLTLLLMVAVLWLMFKNIKKSLIDSPKFWLATMIIPFATLMFGFTLVARGGGLGALEFNAGSDDLVHNLYMGGFVILPAVLSFGLYDIFSVSHERKIKTLLYIKEKEYYVEQLRLMQESTEGLRAFRHDTKSHHAILRQLVKADPEGALGYLDNIAGDLAESEVLCDTGNVALDSIINYKLGNAGQDITAKLKISVPSNLQVEDTAIVIILGNLLDNALEAVAAVDDKIIYLDIEYGKGGLFIKVDNTFNGKVKYKRKSNMEQQLISLKNGERGYGLKNVRQSIEKYNGNMRITHTENEFSVSIFLYLS